LTRALLHLLFKVASPALKWQGWIPIAPMASRLLSVAAAIIAIVIYYYSKQVENVDVHSVDEE
jgi:hypothetical protein